MNVRDRGLRALPAGDRETFIEAMGRGRAAVSTRGAIYKRAKGAYSGVTRPASERGSPTPTATRLFSKNAREPSDGGSGDPSRTTPTRATGTTVTGDPRSTVTRGRHRPVTGSDPRHAATHATHPRHTMTDTTTTTPYATQDETDRETTDEPFEGVYPAMTTRSRTTTRSITSSSPPTPATSNAPASTAWSPSAPPASRRQ